MKMITIAMIMFAAELSFAQGQVAGALKAAALRDPFFISMSEVEALPTSMNVHVIDVREIAEHDARRVKSKHGVWFYPLTELQKKKGYAELMKEIPKTELIVFVCANGARAKLARDYMASLGYQAKFASLYKF